MSAKRKVKKILEEHVSPSESRELIEEIEERARDGEYLRALGCSAAVAERDIRAIRRRSPITAELLSAILADPAGFTYKSITEGLAVDQRAARSRILNISKGIPWLEQILRRRPAAGGRGDAPRGLGSSRNPRNRGGAVSSNKKQK